jgi:RNA recognition motif-containing protein
MIQTKSQSSLPDAPLEVKEDNEGKLFTNFEIPSNTKKTLFIANLNSSVSPLELKDVFSRYGIVTDLRFLFCCNF